MITQDGHLRTRGKCKRVFPTFLKRPEFLSQCNTRLRLLHLLWCRFYTLRVQTTTQIVKRRNLIPLKCYILRLQNFLLLHRELHHKFLQRKCLSPTLTKMLTRGNVAKNNKHAFSMFSTDKTWVVDQSERAQVPIYIIMTDRGDDLTQRLQRKIWHRKSTKVLNQRHNVHDKVSCTW